MLGALGLRELLDLISKILLNPNYIISIGVFL